MVLDTPAIKVSQPRAAFTEAAPKPMRAAVPAVAAMPTGPSAVAREEATPPAMPNCCCMPIVSEEPSSLPTLENLPFCPVSEFDSPPMNELSTSGLILIVACFSALSIAEKKLEKFGVATSVFICGTFRLPIVRSRFCSSVLMLEKSAVPVRLKADM